MTDYRRETDLLGSRDVPADACGASTRCGRWRTFRWPAARHPALVHAFGAVKLAAARTNHELGRWDDATFAAIEAACEEMIAGQLDEHIVVDALQGGAGTSTNMNVNEVLANRALQLLGRPLGDYQTVNPHDDINLHQSTNDTYPTALRVAAIFACAIWNAKSSRWSRLSGRRRRSSPTSSRSAAPNYRTPCLSTLGREMRPTPRRIARDRWRIYKCEERLRVVNLGGTAIGTGLSAPRQYIFRVVEHLRQITGLGLARRKTSSRPRKTPTPLSKSAASSAPWPPIC